MATAVDLPPALLRRELVGGSTRSADMAIRMLLWVLQRFGVTRGAEPGTCTVIAHLAASLSDPVSAAVIDAQLWGMQERTGAAHGGWGLPHAADLCAAVCTQQTLCPLVWLSRIGTCLPPHIQVWAVTSGWDGLLRCGAAEQGGLAQPSLSPPHARQATYYSRECQARRSRCRLLAMPLACAALARPAAP